MDEIKEKPVWILWKKEMKNERLTKVPYTKHGTYAATDNPDTWDTYETLFPFLKKGYDGLGIVFERTAGVIGIDLDHCVSKGEIDEDFLELVKKAKTYTEYSPSETGVHMLFRSNSQIPLLRNKKVFDKSTSKALEVYSWGRYFTFTENETRDSKEIRTVTEGELTGILDTIGYPWSIEQAEEANIPEENKVLLSDETVLSKMFEASNGTKVRVLYEGDMSENDNDASSADYALCCHLAFWTQKDFAQIERLWLASPLGQREKTQKRKDYRTRTINNAIKQTQEVYTVQEVSEKILQQAKYDFKMVDKGPNKPAGAALVFVNIVRVIRHHPLLKGKFRLNDFSHMTETCLDESEWIVINDTVISKVREIVSEEFVWFLSLNKSMVTDAIIHAASENRVNPPKEYITGITWDKVPRLNSWLHNAYGVPDDALHQSIASNWFKGLVKRVIRPGCQFDEVLALESPQGWRKSSSIRALGEPWHVETTNSIDNKDFHLILAQNIIVEFSEGEIFDRTSVNKIKAEVTKTEDQVRPPYERGIVKFKRSNVFAITTNKLELKDDTGNRRWLPVELQKPADIDWIVENRDQLYAEAYYRAIIDGETSHEYPREMLEELQKSRTEYSEEEELIARYCATRPEAALDAEGVSLKQLVRAQYPDSNRESYHEKVFASYLRKMHMENKSIRIEGIPTKRWFPTERTKKMLAEARLILGDSLEAEFTN